MFSTGHCVCRYCTNHWDIWWRRCWTNTTLPEHEASLQKSLLPRFAQGQSNASSSEGESVQHMWGIAIFFFHLCKEVRLPEVSFFWAPLMEQEIIMSWPINNCMPFMGHMSIGMLYVLHPWWSLTKQRCFCFFSPFPHLQYDSVFTKSKQTNEGLLALPVQRRRKTETEKISHFYIYIYIHI